MQNQTYGDWIIFYDPKPVPAHIAGSWTYHHKDYDGAPDAHDDRHGDGQSPDDCHAQIDALEAVTLLEALDALANGHDLNVPDKLRAHIAARFEDRRMDGDGSTFDEFCAVWADNIRDEQNGEENK